MNSRGGFLLALAILVTGTSAVWAQDKEWALGVLKKQGLVQQDGIWVLKEELRLQEEMKRFDEVVQRVLPMHRRFKDAVAKNGQRLTTRLKSVQQELEQVERELESSRLLSARAKRVLRAKRNRLRRELESLERTTWWWTPKRVRGNATLNRLAKEYAPEHQKAAAYFRLIWKLDDICKNRYRSMPRFGPVASALKILGPQVRLGPLADHAKKFREMEPELREIMDGPVPVFFEDGYFWTYITVREKLVLVRITEIPCSSLLLSKKVAMEVGIKWDDSLRGTSTLSGRDERGRSFNYQLFKGPEENILIGGYTIPKSLIRVIDEDDPDTPSIFSLPWLRNSKSTAVYFYKDMLILGIGSSPKQFGYEVYAHSPSATAGRPGPVRVPPVTNRANEPEVYVPF